MINIIDLVLSLLGTIIPQLTKSGAAPAVIADVQAAVAALQKVQGTPVTYAQLESLRVTPEW